MNYAQFSLIRICAHSNGNP